jgi:hypothetical protein
VSVGGSRHDDDDRCDVNHTRIPGADRRPDQ